ncbi:MAG: porin [Candidatus Latescibacterota bacterium]
MTRRRLAGLLAGGLLVLPAGSGAASAPAPAVHGYVQVWATLYEELENGLRQAGSNDLAQQEVSGFSLRRARVSFADSLGRAALRYRVEVLLEKSARLTDCYLAARLGRHLEVQVGQMKIPSTYEVAASSTRLDFVERAAVSARAPDWALSRTPYIATFMGNQSFLRDVGVALEGRAGPVRWRGMVGNGLGANLFVGGTQHREFVLTNRAGRWFYGVRADVEAVPWLMLGAHGSLNRHDDMLFNDQRTVIDLDRRSASADVLLRLPAAVRVQGLWAAGAVDDAYYRDGKTNYQYTGYELRALWWPWPERVETGLRFDRYADETGQSGDRVVQDTWTLGVNLRHGPQARLQVNYLLRDTDQRYEPDRDDDALLANVQVTF